MHWFDVGASIALLIGGVWSFFRGLTREILSLLGLIAAFMLATHGYPYTAPFLTTFVPQLWLRQAVSFGLIFFATVVLYVLFIKIAHRLVKAAGLSFPDRLLGGLFGILKVGVIIAALLLIITQFFPRFSNRLATQSLLAPPFFRVANLLAMLLPEQAADEFHRAYQRLHQQFPVWLPTPLAPPRSSDLPAVEPAPPAAVRPDGISEHDARAMEKILQERLRQP